MNSILNNVIIFAAGAAVGGLVTWKVVESKYRKAVNDEIEALKEEYDKRLNLKITVAKSQFDDKPDLQEYASMVKQYGHAVNDNEEDYEIKHDHSEDEIREPDDKGIHVISPDDFDEYDDYDSNDYTYYADGILADEYGNIIDDIEETVGADFASHFGEYSRDAVHIRNDWLECDYEICKDLRNYYDVFPDYMMEE